MQFLYFKFIGLNNQSKSKSVQAKQLKSIFQFHNIYKNKHQSLSDHPPISVFVKFETVKF